MPFRINLMVRTDGWWRFRPMVQPRCNCLFCFWVAVSSALNLPLLLLLIPGNFDFCDNTLWASTSPLSRPLCHDLLGKLLTCSCIEVDRAHENLQKSGKGYVMGARREFSIPY